MHPDAQLAGRAGEERRELAVDRLGLGQAGGPAEIVDVLGQDREVRAGRGRAAQQVTGRGQIGRPVIAGIELADGDTHDCKGTARSPAPRSPHGTVSERGWHQQHLGAHGS